MDINAYAKINLGLEVLGKRSDGYHLVSMIMQSVSLCDTLTINKRSDKEIKITCDKYYVPTDSRNLVYKAADYLINEYNLENGVDIHIAKNIPVAAGLAGGSSDCAATLKAMNKIFNLGLTTEELMDIGLKFGADVPYCIHGGAMLAEGLGEKLSPVKPLKNCYIVISKPKAFLSTAKIYQGLGYEVLSDDKLEEKVNENPMKDIIEALNNENLELLKKSMFNRLEDVSSKLESRIKKIEEVCEKPYNKSRKKKKSRPKPAIRAMMSGSGPSVFAIFEDEKSAKEVSKILKYKLRIEETYICKPLQ